MVKDVVNYGGHKLWIFHFSRVVVELMVHGDYIGGLMVKPNYLLRYFRLDSCLANTTIV